VLATSGDDQIILTTASGSAIRFQEADTRPMGRAASGVIGIRLEPDDVVVGASRVPHGAEKGLTLMAVMANGYGKRTQLKEYKVQHRGGVGILTANITSKTGRLVWAHVTSEEYAEMIAVSRRGHVIRSAIKEVPVLGRATQGVRIMKLESGDELASVVLV
jgi:DNA gyrase subunit A